MAAQKYIVTHRSLYLSVGGKLQEMKYGSEVKMDEATAKNLVASGKLIPAKDVEAVDLSTEESAEKAKK